jgi:carboxymethylenebutenolidase
MKESFVLFLSCCLVLAVCAAGCTTGLQGNQTAPAIGNMTSITAAGNSYPAYLAAPRTAGRHPGIVLIHSFNGLEQGYKDMCDQIAVDGFVVIAPAWQTYHQQAGDPELEAIIRSSVATLESRPDVNGSALGLTGFCAGGRYTMLFLPQVKEFSSGVAFYGFPYNRGFTNNTMPVEHIDELSVPMLMIHGSRDQASPVTDIFTYTQELDRAGKYFELKEYQGKPHGFMIVNGSFVQDFTTTDAYNEMITFFRRTLS